LTPGGAGDGSKRALDDPVRVGGGEGDSVATNEAQAGGAGNRRVNARPMDDPHRGELASDGEKP